MDTKLGPTTKATAGPAESRGLSNRYHVPQGAFKLLVVGLLLLGVDLAANAVNSLGFSWMYTIQPTSIWAFPLTNAEIIISLAIGYGWNIVIVVWFLFFSSSPLANGFSKNKMAIAFGLLLIGFCLGDWMSNFWAILNIPSIVTAYWVGLTLVINLSKSYALAYLYADVSETMVVGRFRDPAEWSSATDGATSLG